MDENVKTVSDFMDIVKRRKWSIILPMVCIFSTAVLVAFLIPPTYRATSTVLIEEQEIPREYVMTTVTSYAEQRLQSITQRIMSSSRLLDIINRFNLYADVRGKWTSEEIIAKMRKDIKFETISGDVVDRRTGRPTEATIAFTIAFSGKRPDVVQQVANVLASLYLEENLKAREQQTTSAAAFIDEEMKRVQASLAGLDAKIANFKSRNLNSLPELAQLNLQAMESVERSNEQLKEQLRTMREKEMQLQTQLAVTPARMSAGAPTEPPNPEKDRLTALRSVLVMLKSQYSDAHPDVIKTKTEIAELERRVGPSVPEKPGEARPDNPAFITLSSQLSGVQLEMESVKRQIAETEKKRQEMNKRVLAGPQVEEHYRVLLTERNNTQAKYDDLMKKGMEAKMASGMEKGQMGERFTLIDSARLPEKPVSPNIPAILLIGFILSIGSGIGLAALNEYGDQSARTVEVLAYATSVNVLAGIPEIVIEEDVRRIWRKRIIWILVLTACLLAGIVAFHFLFMEMDVLWARIMRRYMMM